jgi:MYXO-CTERM domain-containing protein
MFFVTRMTRLLSGCAFALLLVPVPAAAFQVQGPAWNSEGGPIEYRLHPDGSDDISDGSDLDAVRDAFATWSCAAGSGLRFIEGETIDARVNDQTDLINSVYWDETGQVDWAGMRENPDEDPIPIATVGLVPFYPGEPAVRDAFDIIFNGVDYQWTSEAVTEEGFVNVYNMALIEIGTALGLSASCENPDDQSTCLGPDEAVMTNLIPGAPRDGLEQDDIDAMVSLYGTEDGSNCEGPFRQGEACACNSDCVEGQICAPNTAGDLVCAPLCDSDGATCPTGYGCVYAAQDEDGLAVGVCGRGSPEGQFPVAATCENDRQCAEGLCTAADPIGRTVCRKSCDADGDCPSGYLCTDSVCTGNPDRAGNTCEGETGGDCACAGTSDQPASLLWLSLLVVAPWLRRRRR